MKNKKVTITYQATEPKEYVYRVKRYYGEEEGEVYEQVAASIGSLLEWFFDDLSYRKTNDGEFVPDWQQNVWNLKDHHRTFARKRVTKVEIESQTLYV